MKKLLVAAEVERSFLDAARAESRFDLRVHLVRSEQELAQTIGDAEILVTRTYVKVTPRVIAAAPRLELIAQGTSGVDNIDLTAARARGITVLNLPGENANAVAELVIGYIIALTRTVPYYTREMVAGRWTRDDCATRHELRHYRLGIVGFGQVGSRVGRLARAFGMTPRAYDPYIGDFPERVDSLEDLVSTSDIVTMHVPLTEETRRMIDPRKLRKGTILINASRGEVIDQPAALAALAANHLGGLALDVFDPEPPQSPFPDDPRLILTPHIGGCTHECKTAIGEKLYRKIVEYYAGEQRAESKEQR